MTIRPRKRWLATGLLAATAAAVVAQVAPELPSFTRDSIAHKVRGALSIVPVDRARIAIDRKPELDRLTRKQIGWTTRFAVHAEQKHDGGKLKFYIATVVVFASAGTWTVPSDWNNASNKIE